MSGSSTQFSLERSARRSIGIAFPALMSAIQTMVFAKPGFLTRARPRRLGTHSGTFAAVVVGSDPSADVSADLIVPISEPTAVSFVSVYVVPPTSIDPAAESLVLDPDSACVATARGDR